MEIAALTPLFFVRGAGGGQGNVDSVPLDTAGLHVLTTGPPGISIEYTGGDRKSAAHEAMLAALRIEGGRPFLALEDGTLLDVARHRLCPFELRYAADHGRLHPVPNAARDPGPIVTPITDLHTHYAGCISGSDLVTIGIEHGVTYPSALLAG